MLLKKEGYNWKYCSLGGAIRIAIENGEDIAHLPELDKKLWTVLSCPVDGLEFNHRTLQLLDTDHDGKIRIKEVSEAAKWVTSVLKDPDILIKKLDAMPLDGFNQENPDGAMLAERCAAILKSLGSDKAEITVDDVNAFIAGIDERCNKAKEEAVAKEELSAPFGDKSDDAAAAVAAVRAKMDDFFIRCSLIKFDGDCAGALDVSVESIAAISGNNLTACGDQISSYPLARPSADGLLKFDEGVNPAWQPAFANLKELVLDVEFPGAKSIDRAQWDAVVSKIDTFISRKNAIAGTSAEVLDSSLAAEREFVAPVERFIHLQKNFFTFLNNYVSFRSLYDKDEMAVFQAGFLYIDMRACGLCLKVSDMGRHGDMANLSGMYLIYCDCFSKEKNEKMEIVAVMTEGSVGQIRVGKNAVFYDRNGLDWDAVVTKIIENPISIKQAMWSPYRRFFNWCGEQINKFAAEKDSKNFSTVQESTAKAHDNVATAAADKEVDASKKQAFDIAKFCGIFAAIGMALGYIGSFCVSVVTGFLKLSWWQMPLSIVAVMLVISGPSMLIAWFKLRNRNLGPVLNANGWAINSLVKVNVKFGAQLTHLANYPKLNLYDPFQKKKVAAWKKWFWSILFILIAGAAAAVWFLDLL